MLGFLCSFYIVFAHLFLHTVSLAGKITLTFLQKMHFSTEFYFVVAAAAACQAEKHVGIVQQIFQDYL